MEITEEERAIYEIYKHKIDYVREAKERIKKAHWHLEEAKRVKKELELELYSYAADNGRIIHKINMENAK